MKATSYHVYVSHMSVGKPFANIASDCNERLRAIIIYIAHFTRATLLHPIKRRYILQQVISEGITTSENQEEALRRNYRV